MHKIFPYFWKCTYDILLRYDYLAKEYDYVYSLKIYSHVALQKNSIYNDQKCIQVQIFTTISLIMSFTNILIC